MEHALAERAARARVHAQGHPAWEAACEGSTQASERARVRARWTRWAEALEGVVREGARTVRLPARGLARLEDCNERTEKIGRALVRAAIERAPEALREAAAQALVDDEPGIEAIARALDPGTPATRGAQAATEAIGAGHASGWCEGCARSIALERIEHAHEGGAGLRDALAGSAPWLAWRTLCEAPSGVLEAPARQWLRWAVRTALGHESALGDDGLAGWPWPEIGPPLGAASAAWRAGRTLARSEWENAGAAVQRAGERSEAQGLGDAHAERARAAVAVARAIEQATQRWWRRNAPGAWRSARARFEEAWPAALRTPRAQDLTLDASGRGLAWEIESQTGNEVFAAHTQVRAADPARVHHEAARVAASVAGSAARGGHIGFVLRAGTVTTLWRGDARGGDAQRAQAMGDALARALGRAVAR